MQIIIWTNYDEYFVPSSYYDTMLEYGGQTKDARYTFIRPF